MVQAMNIIFTEDEDGVPFLQIEDSYNEWTFATTLTDEQVQYLHTSCNTWLKSAGIFPESPTPSEKEQHNGR
jgi:hypothetical protein